MNYGVIWDMDGVLVDTGEWHYRAWAKVLHNYGVTLRPEDFWQTFGMNNTDVLRVFIGPNVTPEFVKQVSDEKEQAFRDAARGQITALPGVREWLAWLQADGARQAVGSSAPMANINALIDELGVRPYFDALISGEHLPGKPNPATFVLAAQKLGLVFEHCVVIEDAVTGVQAAKRAGMKCLAITNTNPASALYEADKIVDSLESCSPELIKQWLVVI
jgi:beta-phosphoglucomutase family hydrolase